MSKETPLQTVKRVYGSKDKLVDALLKALEGLGEESDDLEERLSVKPNSKLLRLMNVATRIKDRFGSRDKLIAAIAEAANKAKDSAYVERLSILPLPRLLDMALSGERRARNPKKQAKGKRKAA